MVGTVLFVERFQVVIVKEQLQKTIPLILLFGSLHTEKQEKESINMLLLDTRIYKYDGPINS